MISRRNFLKVCAVAGSAGSRLCHCGGGRAAARSFNTDQTKRLIVGGRSALVGYNDNGVLKKLADGVGG